MLDFPASPTNGQKFPQPAVSGVPVYTWDGEKWTTAGGEIVTATPATALPLINATPAVVGVTLKYAREDHVHPTDTTRTSVTDVNNIVKAYAAPYDAMAYSGMQINGGMEVNQQGGAVSTHTAYILDGYKLMKAGTAVVSAAGGRPSNLIGIPAVLVIQVTTAQPAMTAGDLVGVLHLIEGYRTACLKWGTASAQPITIAFWTQHIRPGLYTGVVRNSPGDRTYAFTYTQAVSDTWQYNTVTVPGDVTGTWFTDNTIGMAVHFAVASGTTFAAPSANNWLAGNFYAAPNQVNGVAATSDVFRLTGVTVLPGTQAPTAAQSPNIMRPYDQELVTCKRYFYNGVPVANGGTSPSLADRMACRHPLTMRIVPTVTITSALPVWDGVNTGTITAVTNNYSTTTDLEFSGSLTGTFQAGAGRMMKLYQGAGGNLNVDARL